MEENVEKRKALEVAMSQIEKQFGKGSVMKLGEFKAMEIEAIPTGALSLDIALGIGGVPRGRIIEVYGPESSGKTTLALHVIAEAQKKGGEAAFIDAEHALDPVYAKKLGAQAKTLTEKREKFKELCIEEKCIVLYEILHFFQCQSVTADLKLIGGSGRAGILYLNKNITDCSRIEMIHQSPTGIYEQAVDLNAL